MLLRRWVSGQDEQQHDNRYSTDGQIDPKAPAPVEFRREEAAEQGSGNGCEAECGADETEKLGPLLQGK